MILHHFVTSLSNDPCKQTAGNSLRKEYTYVDKYIVQRYVDSLCTVCIYMHYYKRQQYVDVKINS